MRPHPEPNNTLYGKLIRIEFPKFSGDDMKDWVYRCKQFFKVDGVLDGRKIQLASMHMFGAALVWYQQYMKKAQKPQADWIRGLKPKVGTLMRMFQANTLSESYQLARMQEGHKCSGQLHSMEVIAEGDLDNYIDGDDETYDDCVGDMVRFTNSPQITLNALSGLNSYQTMRVRGRVAKKLGCRLDNTTPMQVSVANGQRMMSTFVCYDFKWSFQNEVFTSDVMLLPLGGCEMVLGIQWLATLGDMQCNFKKLIMKFNHKGRQLVLRGMNNTHVHWMQGIEGMLKQVELSSMALCVYLVQLCQMESVESLFVEVEQVLTQFDEAFEVSKDLPPQRSHDHQIPFMPNTPPINMRPYKHPPNQKNTIEGMVKELMDSGVIRASQSPFSSPIIMVKKKDGTWRMCIDYRQLNKHIVKDKFPIPMIEGLIDELNGSVVFSKLNLRSGYHQIRMKEDDICKTTFRTHEGNYKSFQDRGYAKWPIPSTLKQLRGFLGLTGYYRRFIKDYASISQPLVALTKKDAFSEILKRKGKVVVGNDPELVQHFHDEAIGGHSGAHVTMKKLGSLFYWKGLKKMVKQMKEISMDFIEKLPTSHGKSVILVVVDRLSKYAHFIPLAHPFTASQVAQVFLDQVYKLHGLPESIVSDRDKVFLSNFWKALFAELKVKLKLSTAYHPQTDGQTEVVNRSLGCYLRCMCGEKPKEWIKWLPLAEFWYNTNYHTSTKTTPYEVVYCQTPPIHVPYIPGDSRVEEVDRTLQAREEAIKMLKFHLKRLELPSSSQIHPVFHILQLKKFHGKEHIVGVLPQLREDGLLENKPMAILERRLGKVNNKPVMFVLIQWTNKPSFLEDKESLRRMELIRAKSEVNTVGLEVNTVMLKKLVLLAEVSTTSRVSTASILLILLVY
ncbi:reverse transcriptase [Tanacetum coccineum]